MSEPFIKKEITIQAPVSKVWDVLVKKPYLKQWIPEFSQGNIVTEDWHLNSTMTMTDDDGTVVSQGTITEFEPNRRLKVEFQNSDYTEELSLTAKGNGTILSSYAGPVADTDRKKHSEVWDKGLRKIKELSESL